MRSLWPARVHGIPFALHNNGFHARLVHPRAILGLVMRARPALNALVHLVIVLNALEATPPGCQTIVRRRIVPSRGLWRGDHKPAGLISRRRRTWRKRWLTRRKGAATKLKRCGAAVEGVVVVWARQHGVPGAGRGSEAAATKSSLQRLVPGNVAAWNDFHLHVSPGKVATRLQAGQHWAAAEQATASAHQYAQWRRWGRWRYSICDGLEKVIHPVVGTTT